jgi:hypothetical protein
MQYFNLGVYLPFENKLSPMERRQNEVAARWPINIMWKIEVASGVKLADMLETLKLVSLTELILN